MMKCYRLINLVWLRFQNFLLQPLLVIFGFSISMSWLFHTMPSKRFIKSKVQRWWTAKSVQFADASSKSPLTQQTMKGCGHFRHSASGFMLHTAYASLRLTCHCFWGNAFSQRCCTKCCFENLLIAFVFGKLHDEWWWIKIASIEPDDYNTSPVVMHYRTSLYLCECL